MNSFEAAMSAYCDPKNIEETFYRDGEYYQAYATMFAWEAWQAARATPVDQEPVYLGRIETSEGTEAWVELANEDRQYWRDTVRTVYLAPQDVSARLAALEKAMEGISQAWVYWRESGHVAEYDEIALYAAPQHSDIEQYVLSVLPGSYYMDPPDGGDVSILEQLRRMADDASKYRAMVKAPQPEAQSVRDAVIEECLQACREQEIVDPKDRDDRLRNIASEDCWRAIRSLKSAPPQKPVSDEVKP